MKTVIDLTKGTLLRRRPYKVSSTGVDGKKVVINPLSNLKVDDMVYQIGFPDGTLVFLPEEVYSKLVD